MSKYATRLIDALSPLTTKIVTHPIYEHLATQEHLKLFMEQHVFAVWDFMCLLKELHRHIVTTAAPWLPPKDALSANLIGSILAEEEGDIIEDGIHYQSHYEIYLRAMEKLGADTSQIKQLQVNLLHGTTINDVLENLHIRQKTKDFVKTTFSFFNQDAHAIAAAFVYGREGITANMFAPIIKKIEAENNGHCPTKLDTLVYYLKRHVQLDSEEHFPKALQMMENLINGDPQKFQEAEQAAITALNARIEFLDDIYILIQD